MTEPETATDSTSTSTNKGRRSRLYRRRAAARSERLLPPYGRRVPDQIEARRRIAEDLLEVLVALRNCGQSVCPWNSDPSLNWWKPGGLH